MSSAPSELCFDCANCVEMLPKGTKKSVIVSSIPYIHFQIYIQWPVSENWQYLQRPEILERLTRIEDRIEVQTTLLRGMATNRDYEKKIYTDDDDELVSHPFFEKICIYAKYNPDSVYPGGLRGTGLQHHSWDGRSKNVQTTAQSHEP